MGHHSPAFTLDTYVHLLPDDLPDAVGGGGGGRRPGQAAFGKVLG